MYYRFLHQGKPKSLLWNSWEFYVLPIKGTGIVGDKFPHPPYDMIMSAVLCDINNQPALNQWKANVIFACNPFFGFEISKSFSKKLDASGTNFSKIEKGKTSLKYPVTAVMDMASKRAQMIERSNSLNN